MPTRPKSRLSAAFISHATGNFPRHSFSAMRNAWGWATWKRAWAKFNLDGRELLAEIERRKLARVFDQDDTYPYTAATILGPYAGALQFS